MRHAGEGGLHVIRESLSGFEGVETPRAGMLEGRCLGEEFDPSRLVLWNAGLPFAMHDTELEESLWMLLPHGSLKEIPGH